MAQTSYPLVPPVAFAGMLDALAHKFAESRAQAESSAEVPFGVAVAEGADETKAILPAASTAKVIGLVIHSHTYAPSYELGTVGIKPKCMLSVLRKGRIWVVVEEAVVPGDRLFVRYASGAGGTQLGGIRKSAVTSETIDCTGMGIFRTTQATVGGLAILEVDFSNEP